MGLNYRRISLQSMKKLLLLLSTLACVVTSPGVARAPNWGWFYMVRITVTATSTICEDVWYRRSIHIDPAWDAAIAALR